MSRMFELWYQDNARRLITEQTAFDPDHPVVQRLLQYAFNAGLALGTDADVGPPYSYVEAQIVVGGKLYKRRFIVREGVARLDEQGRVDELVAAFDSCLSVCAEAPIEMGQKKGQG